MFACLFIPNFSVAAVTRAEPELCSQALALLEGIPPLEKVFAVNQKAAAMTISAGMTKAQAELCPQLILRLRSPLQESATHEALLDCAQSFSPCVEDAAADTALLDLAGMESLFGPLPEIARAILNRAASLGLAAHVAVASNPDAAMLAACGFGGVTVIPAGQEADQLGPLPVDVFRNLSFQPPSVSEGRRGLAVSQDESHETLNRLLETLGRWGIRNLRSLAALPEVALSERLGQQGLRLQQLARGAASRTLVPVEEPLIFEEAVELEDPIRLLEPLAFLLNRLLEQICARLASRSLATQQLHLALELEAGSSSSSAAHFHRTLNLPLPMLDARLFLKLLQLDLNANPPGAPIVKIHLAAEPTRPRSAQAGLFLPPSPEPEKLELTLARIASLVGESRVGALELLDTHRAEGFRMKHFAPSQAVAGKITNKTNPGPDRRLPVENTDPSALRAQASQLCYSDPRASAKGGGISPPVITALRIFRPPLRASVTLENGEPVHIACARKKEVQGSVLWKAGPWRSSGDWWERDAWSRDEWDIALQNPEQIALYRLVHDLLNGIWFVEGTYD